MSPFISTALTINQLRTESTKIDNPLVRAALDSQVRLLNRKLMREQTLITLGRDNAQRERNDQERKSIKCGLRHAKENPGYLPLEGWHLKKESAQKLHPEHRLAAFFRKFLHQEVPIPLLKKLTKISPKPSILFKTLDLEFLSVIPASRRWESGDKLLMVIAAKVG
jgi:hypothetical protein